MQPIKAMKHVAEYILSMHALVTADEHCSSPLLTPFFSFVYQCLTYFSELVDAPAGTAAFILNFRSSCIS
jgi:hypothetical protein